MAHIPVMPAKAGIQNPIIGESTWIPAYAGMTKDAIHPRFKKRGILAYLRKKTWLNKLVKNNKSSSFQLSKTLKSP
jgi:hypothetical protein